MKKFKLTIAILIIFSINGCMLSPYNEANTIRGVLEKNSSNLLYPNDLSEAPVELGLDFTVGYLVKQYYSNGEIDTKKEYYKLYKTDSSANYFKHLDENFSMSDAEIKLDNYTRFIKYTKSGDFSSHVSHFNECEFKLGKCQYQNTTGKSEVNTTFKDGVWITKFRGFGASDRTMKRIYSKSGILLFRSNHGYFMGKETYGERIAFLPNPSVNQQLSNITNL